MIFQQRCRVKIEPEDVQFARRALCTPGMVTPGEDLVMGEAMLWDGSTVSIQLRGVPQKPAFMIAAVFDHSGNFMGGVRSDTYCTGFDFKVNGIEYIVSIYTEKALEKETPKPAAAKKPSLSKRCQER